MAEIHEFECPSCGGIMEFDVAAQSLCCPYCGRKMDIEEYEKETEKPDGEVPAAGAPDSGTEEAQGWTAEETENMRVYVCDSCGAEIVGSPTEAAGCCPYCGSNILMKGQFADALRPDGVIPFQLDKQAAKQAYQKHLKGKKLLPAMFRSENHIKKIQGLYVPFWLFDGDAVGEITMTGEKTSSRRSGKTVYTDHRVYEIRRAGTMSFRDVPTDGSMRMDDTLMEAIEPFDASKIVPFRSAYLAGFRADRYDVDEDQRKQRAEQRMRSSVEQTLVQQVTGYDSTTPPKLEAEIRNLRSRYVLYPVWILSTRWKGETFTFAMNGQTGKMVGDLPMDKGAFWLRFVGMAAAFSAILYGVTAFIMHLA